MVLYMFFIILSGTNSYQIREEKIQMKRFEKTIEFLRRAAFVLSIESIDRMWLTYVDGIIENLINVNVCMVVVQQIFRYRVFEVVAVMDVSFFFFFIKCSCM